MTYVGRKAAFGLVLALVLAFGSKSALAAGSFFSAIDAPSGVAAAPGKLLVTEYCGERRHLLKVDDNGNWTIFASLPLTVHLGGCSEIYLAIAPGLGGFK